MTELSAKGKASGELTVLAKTRVSVILDRSGSMETMREDVIGGFNNLVEEQAETEGEMSWTMLQFDSTGLEHTFKDTPTDKVPKLTRNNFRPRGMTPLLDAVGNELARLGEGFEPTIVVIITDGLENASSEYSLETVKSMIEAREALGWQFIFLGANQDAFASSYGYGMSRGSSVTYDQDSVAMAYNSVSTTMSTYRETGDSVSLHEDVTKTPTESESARKRRRRKA